MDKTDSPMRVNNKLGGHQKRSGRVEDSTISSVAMKNGLDVLKIPATSRNATLDSWNARSLPCIDPVLKVVPLLK
jgi:hypothetical protein